VLLWAGLATLTGAAIVAGRWLLHTRDGLGRPRAFPVVSVLVLTAVGVGLLVPVVRHGRLESRLSDVTSDLVGREVRVHCQTAGQEFLDAGSELGYVRYGADGVPEPVTLIKRAQCADLRDYLGSGKEAPSRDQVIAVHVLSHEARHLAGEKSESAAECQALQRDALTAELLGADPAEAVLLAQRYWRELYPAMPGDYRSGDCVPGGRLDERIPGAPW
jgi:hypothetical protein